MKSVTLKVGDIIIYPGLGHSNVGTSTNPEAYLITEVRKTMFRIEWGQGQWGTYVDLDSAIKWIQTGTHRLISDEKEKLAFLLTNQDIIQ
jgi:hypothetical protein